MNKVIDHLFLGDISSVSSKEKLHLHSNSIPFLTILRNYSYSDRGSWNSSIVPQSKNLDFLTIQEFKYKCI